MNEFLLPFILKIFDLNSMSAESVSGLGMFLIFRTEILS